MTSKQQHPWQVRAVLVIALAGVCAFVPALASAACGDGVLDPGEECDPVGNNDAACPRLCVPVGFPDACTCARPPKDPRTYVVIGNERINLGLGVGVDSGNIGVLVLDGALTIGANSILPAAESVVGDWTRVRPFAQVGRLFARTLKIKTGAIVAGGVFHFDPPLALDPPLPAPPGATPGVTAISVPDDGTLVLGPGAFDKVIVGLRATLILRGFDPVGPGGTYDMRSLKLLFESRMVADNPVTLRIAEKMALKPRTSLGPSALAPIAAGDVQIHIAGFRSRVSHSATVRAHIRGDEASVGVGSGTSLAGRLIARRVRIGRTAVLAREGGCGDERLDASEQCDTSAAGGDAACPGLCLPPGGQGQCRCACTGPGDCDDGDVCDGAEVCEVLPSSAMACAPGPPLDCEDGDTCTSDSCDPGTGCSNVPIPGCSTTTTTSSTTSTSTSSTVP